MLYVTITTANGRTTRGRYETDDRVEAISQALANVTLDSTREFAGATVLAVLVEAQGTQLTKADLAEQLEIMRTEESKRAG